MNGQRLARGLGLFSLGLGAIQLAAPNRFARWIGVRPREDREASVRFLGVRELAAAAGLLARPSAVLLWMRVAGDVMDLALLRRAMRARDTRPDRAGAAMAAVAGVTALDLLGSVQLTRQAAMSRNGHGVLETGSTTMRPNDGRLNGRGLPRQVVKAVTINRPTSDLYAFWRQLENLPRFMLHLDSVQALDDRRSRWMAKAPLGMKVEWEAEIVDEVPDERISWRSVEGSQVHNAGTVSFRPAPGGRGTIVTAELSYDPPGGPLGVAIAKLTGEEPEQQTADDLRRFKQIMETGEVVYSEATYGDRKVRQRPAQPVETTVGA